MNHPERRTKQFKRYLAFYPWFTGFSADLLFWIAIDSLFLQFVKGIPLSDIVWITAVSDTLGIILQFPMLKVVERLGNTRSVRLGTFLALASACTLTFGQSFAMMVLGKALRELSFSCKTMNSVSLKHNLECLGRQQEFFGYSTKGNTIYAITTMLISLVASMMFNFNHYLPMLCCIAFCILCCILSFYMADYTEEDIRAVPQKEQPVKEKTRFSKLIIWSLVTYGIFFSIVTTGQDNTKLFVQDELWKSFDEANTALILGVIVFTSRVVRVFANIVFQNIYMKMRNKVGILLPLLLFSSFVFMLGGYAVPSTAPIFKYSLMGLGYIVILFARDPFKIYIQDLVMRKSENRYHPKIMMLLELSRKITTAIIGLSFAAIVSATSMVSIIVIYAIYAGIEIGVAIYLYRLTKQPALNPVIAPTEQ